MGTQQILLIVLSVIIVGAAIAVGITMFNNQAYSANKSAIASDAQSFATQVVQYYKTPESQGGAGQKLDASNAMVAMSPQDIASYIGWGTVAAEVLPTVTTENGTYGIISTTTNTVVIVGLGKEVKDNKRARVQTTITLPDGTIEAEVTDVVSTVVVPAA